MHLICDGFIRAFADIQWALNLVISFNMHLMTPFNSALKDNRAAIKAFCKFNSVNQQLAWKNIIEIIVKLQLLY